MGATERLVHGSLRERKQKTGGRPSVILLGKFSVVALFVELSEAPVSHFGPNLA